MQEDYEELCVRLREVVGRADLGAEAKVDAIRGILDSETGRPTVRAHEWRETGAVPLEDGSGDGQSIQYVCATCGAKGYQITYATSVTMYPIVSDSPGCSG